MDKFEQMVETIEEAEDMVECKECFDLFPKAECTKIDHGYICPTCGREQQSQNFSDVSFTDITTDLYDQEFPDVREYDSEFGPEMEEHQKEYHVDDIVDALIKDEYDAIESYELADEMIQEADVDEDMKDDLLDTIEHIKEEEEEHIDEINKAAGRVEADPEDEDKKDDDSEDDSDSKDEDDDKDEDKDDKDSDKEDDDKDEDDEEKNEDLTEAVPSPEMVEGEEILDEKKESVFNKIWKPVNESCTWVCRFKDQEVGTVEATTEEEALEKMQAEYPEYNYGEYDGCFEVCQEADCEKHDAVTHTKDDLEILNEANIFTQEDKRLNSLFTKGYIIAVRGTDTKHTAKTFKDAEKLAIKTSKAFPDKSVDLFAAPLDPADYEKLDSSEKQLVAKGAGNKMTVLAIYSNGKAKLVDEVSKITKALKTAAKYKKAVSKTDTSTAEDEESAAINAMETDSESSDTDAAPEDKKTEPAGEPEAEEVEEVASNSGIDFTLLDTIFKGFAFRISNKGKARGIKVSDAKSAFEKIKQKSSEGTASEANNQVVYFLAGLPDETAYDPEKVKQGKKLIAALNRLTAKSNQKSAAKGYPVLTAFQNGEQVKLHGGTLLELIQANKATLEKLINEEDIEGEDIEAKDSEAGSLGSSESSDTVDIDTSTSTASGPAIKVGAIANILGKNGLSGKGNKAKRTNIIKALKDLGVQVTESLEEDSEEEETVECAWCNRELPKCECHKEVDMGWLCDKCKQAINSRGETLTFEQ